MEQTKEKILNEIKNTLEVIKQNDNINIYNILSDEIKNTLELESYNIYISYNKNYCIRFLAPLQYYFLLINKLNLKNNWIDSGLSCAADSVRFSVSWCEHDLTIAFKPVNKK